LVLPTFAGIIFLHVVKRFHGRSWRLFWLLHAFVLRLRSADCRVFGTGRLLWKTCWVFPKEKINDDRLYRALDALLPHKDALCLHLQTRYGELFGSTFDFLFYDITSTYFEGTAKGNAQAKRVTAVTAVLIVHRSVSAWLQRERAYPWPLRFSTATV